MMISRKEFFVEEIGNNFGRRKDIVARGFCNLEESLTDPRETDSDIRKRQEEFWNSIKIARNRF